MEKYQSQKRYHKTIKGKEALYRANKRYKDKFKIPVFNHYGWKCKCCKETIKEFLTIDHINNDGAQHRKKIGSWSIALYRWLVENNFPKGFQTLCFNCNFVKGMYGKCPHKKY